jgi:hypothetical protein
MALPLLHFFRDYLSETALCTSGESARPPAFPVLTARAGIIGLTWASRYTDSSGHQVLRTLIADDEPVARKPLAEELTEIGGVEMVAEAADGTTAAQKISELHLGDTILLPKMPTRVLAPGGRLSESNRPAAVESRPTVLKTVQDTSPNSLPRFLV